MKYSAREFCNNLLNIDHRATHAHILSAFSNHQIRDGPLDKVLGGEQKKFMRGGGGEIE